MPYENLWLYSSGYRHGKHGVCFLPWWRVPSAWFRAKWSVCSHGSIHSLCSKRMNTKKYYCTTLCICGDLESLSHFWFSLSLFTLLLLSLFFNFLKHPQKRKRQENSELSQATLTAVNSLAFESKTALNSNSPDLYNTGLPPWTGHSLSVSSSWTLKRLSTVFIYQG